MKKRKQTTDEDTFLEAHVETVSHIVFRDGKPCKLVNTTGEHRGGLLVPGVPIISYAKPRDAERAVERTIKAREKFKSSFVSDWIQKRMPQFLAGKSFEVLPVAIQK